MRKSTEGISCFLLLTTTIGLKQRCELHRIDNRFCAYDKLRSEEEVKLGLVNAIRSRRVAQGLRRRDACYGTEETKN